MTTKPLLRWVRPWVKAAWVDQQRTLGVRLAAAGPGKLQPEAKLVLTSTPTRYDLPAYRAWPNGQEFSDDDLANFELRYRDTAAVAGDMRVYATGITFSYNQPPTVVVDAVPSPLTVGSWRPTWSFIDPEGDLQESYELRVYEQPTVAGWPDAADADAEIEALDAAGVVAYFTESELTDAQFASVVLLPPTGTLRVYVRAADVGSSQRYSAWSRAEFTMAIPAPPPPPTVTVAAHPEVVSVDVTVAPYGGADIDFVQIERSDDAGITWAALPGTTPNVPYVPVSPNRVNNSAMTADMDVNNVADGWSAYSTPDTDPSPTASRPAEGARRAQRVAWTTNTGYKGVSTQPRVAANGSNIWPADTVWSVSFDWKVSAANSSLLPILPFPSDLFTVTWVSRPAVSTTDLVNYSALVEVGVTHVETDLYIVAAPTITGGWVEVSDVMVAPAGRVLHAGYGTEAYGAMGYGGWTADADETLPATIPYSPRESAAVALVDRFAPREIPVRYRARVGAYSGSGVAWKSAVALSEWAAADPVTLVSDGNDWLQSSTDGTFDVPLKLAGLALQSTSDVKQTILWPEGREDPVVNTGAVHYPAFPALAIACRNDGELAAVETLRRRSLTEPLLLRTCFGEAAGAGLEQRWVKLGALTDTRWGGYPEQRGAQVHDIVVAVQTVAGPS